MVQNYISEKRELAYELSREDLWEEKFRKLNNLMDIIIEKLSEFKLTVGQAYEFYKIIGDDDKSVLNINH